MFRFFLLALVISVLAVATARQGEGRAGAAAIQQGNVNCDAGVTAVDALQVLRSVAGLSTSAACIQEAGDTNCDGGVTAVDALRILRYVAGLVNSVPPGCTAIGQLLVRQPSSIELIEAALKTGTLDEETALKYKVFATFGDDRLPVEYRGDDSGVLDTTAMGEASAKWLNLSLETRTVLAPFFAPPVYQGSGVRDLDASAAAARSKSIAVQEPVDCTVAAGAPPVLDAGYSRKVTAHFSIWYNTAIAQAEETAGFIAGEIENIWDQETTLMGRFPMQDDQEKCNGGDGSWDIYVGRYGFAAGGLTAYTFRAITIGYPAGCEFRPSYMLVNYPFATTLYDARDMMAHEFFHFIELGAYDLAAGCADYNWLGEATATYMIDYVYPDDDYEQQYAADYLGASFANGGGFKAPLEETYWPTSLSPSGSRNGYEDYLFLFYIARKYSATNVRDMWEYSEVFDSLAAVDAAIPGGFLERWHEFALYNLNTPPVNYYEQWDALLLGLSPSGAEYEFQVSLGGQGQREFPISRISLEHLSSRFIHAEIRNDVKRLDFFNLYFEGNEMGDLGRGKIQALIKLADGTTRVEDWTYENQLTFCRDIPSQKVTELFVVWSDSTYLDRSHMSNTIASGKIRANNVGCTKWTGWVSHTHDGGNFVGHDVVETSLAENVVFELDPNLLDPNLPPRYWVTTGGTVNWSHTGSMFGCSGSGSGSYPLSTIVDGGYGQLEVWDDGGQWLRYHGVGTGPSPALPIVMYQCPEGGEVPGGPVAVSDWWSLDLNEFRLQPDGSIRDTVTVTYPGGLGDDTWQWEFHVAP